MRIRFVIFFGGVSCDTNNNRGYVLSRVDSSMEFMVTLQISWFLDLFKDRLIVDAWTVGRRYSRRCPCN